MSKQDRKQDRTQGLWLWLIAAFVLVFPAHHSFKSLLSACPQQAAFCGAGVASGHLDCHVKADDGDCYLEAVLEKVQGRGLCSPTEVGSDPADALALLVRPPTDSFRSSIACSRPPWAGCSSPLHARVGLRLYA